MIQCKNTEILPQAGNDKTTNLQEHNCKAKWDGLHSMDTVSNIFINTDEAKALTMNNQPEKSTDKQKTVLVWLLQSLMSYLKRIPCKDFFTKAQKKASDIGLSQQEVEKAS